MGEGTWAPLLHLTIGRHRIYQKHLQCGYLPPLLSFYSRYFHPPIIPSFSLPFSMTLCYLVKSSSRHFLQRALQPAGLTQVPQGNVKLINISYDHEVYCGTAGILGLTVTGWCLLGLLQGPMERTLPNCPAIGWRGPSRGSHLLISPQLLLGRAAKATLRTLLCLPVDTLSAQGRKPGGFVLRKRGKGRVGIWSPCWKEEIRLSWEQADHRKKKASDVESCKC